jgi:hypothetical protein
LYLQLWFMAGLMSVVFGALLALKPVPKPVTLSQRKAEISHQKVIMRVAALP